MLADSLKGVIAQAPPPAARRQGPRRRFRDPPQHAEPRRADPRGEGRTRSPPRSRPDPPRDADDGRGDAEARRRTESPTRAPRTTGRIRKEAFEPYPRAGGLRMSDRPSIRSTVSCQILVKRGGSDLHMPVGSPPIIRIDGEMDRIRYRNLGEGDFYNMLSAITPPELWARYQADRRRRLRVPDGRRGPFPRRTCSSRSTARRRSSG